MAYQSLEDFVQVELDQRRSSRVYGGLSIMAVVPRSLNFGEVEIDTESESLISEITNKTVRPLDLTSIEGGGTQFDFTTDCPATLAPGESCSIVAKFAPTSLGLKTGVINITSNVKTDAIQLRGVCIPPEVTPEEWNHVTDVDLMIDRLWGFIQRATQPALTGSGPVISMPSASVSFGTVNLGEASQEMTFVISNLGDQPLILDDLTISGDFEIVP